MLGGKDLLMGKTGLSLPSRVLSSGCEGKAWLTDNYKKWHTKM